MKAPWRQIFSALLLLLGTLAAALFWLCGTTGGASWLVRTAARAAPFPVEVGGVSGRLVDELRLTAISARWPSGTATVDSLSLRFLPLPLLRGAVSFDRLIVEGALVTMREAEGETRPPPVPPPDLRWPAVAGPAAWLEGRIDALRLSGIRIAAPRRDPVALAELSARVTWRDGRLDLSELAATLPSARLEGSLSAGFVQPSLRTDLTARLAEGPNGMESLSLSADLGPSPSPGGLAGPVILSAAFPDARRVRLEGRAALATNRAELRDLSLSLPEQQRVVTGRAEAVLSGGGMDAELSLAFHDLDLAFAAGTRTEISGDLELSGGADGYEGRFSLRNAGKGVREIRLRGSVAGDLGGASLPRLRGSWLGGEIAGTVSLSWREGLQVEGSLAGRSLDPARVDADWPGRVNFTLRGRARKEGSSPLHAGIEARLLDSTLRGRTLAGEVRARLDEGGLQVPRLELHGEGFDVRAHGALRERLEFSADVPRLGGLLPGAEGSVSATGWIRWRDGPAGAVLTARGEALSFEEVRADSVSVSARWEGEGHPFVVEGEGRGVAVGAIRVAAASVGADGTLEEHELRFSLRWADGDARGSARGTYRSGTWEGTLVSLSAGGDRLGTWSLAAPVRLALSSGRVTVSPFRVTAVGGGSVAAQADLSLDPWRGSVEAEWEGIDPALADFRLGDVRLSGSSSGHARGEWPADGPPSVVLRLTASGSILHGERALRVDRAEAELSWDGEGLAARWSAGFGDNGALAGSVSSGRPPRLGVPAEGEARAQWRSVDLSLLAPWTNGLQVEGGSSGELEARWREDGAIALSGRADLSGGLRRGDRRLEVRSARLALEAGEEGTRLSLDAVLGGGGTVTAGFVSPAAARAGIPQGGALSATWESVDLALFAPWVPPGLALEGTLSGRGEGEMLPEGKFDLGGEAAVRDGKLEWRGEGKAIKAALRSAELRWSWREEAVGGDFSLSLEEYGRAEGKFRLPLPAGLPLEMRHEGEVSATLSATFREKGLLPAFFPGMLQESSGTLALELRVAGTWGSPELSGTATLAEAGAYLPAAGIHLRGVEATAAFAGREIRIETLAARSGDGSVEGTGTVRLDGWTLSGYQGTLKGKDFRTVDLPELRMATSPDLTIEGTAERLQVRGELGIPDLLVYGRQTPLPVRRSEDVVFARAEGASEEETPVSLDIEVKITLGKHVLVKAQGIDARLEGTVTLRTVRENEFAAQGEVQVAEGHYSTYGVRLQITRGRLLFAGGPVERPALDILATRTVGEVKAGVQVTGTLRQPVVKLYSDPALPDTDVLSYVVLGRPLGRQSEGGGQADTLMLAAGALLPMAESTVLRNRLGRHFGIDVVQVQTGEDVKTGSAITVGKYLNPRLYVSYGRSIFTDASEFTMRYDLGKRWQVESRYGEESGVDLYYKIEFR